LLTTSNREHSEDALLVDWSEPPPWPAFIGVNTLADMLRKAADALTPPPILVLDQVGGFQVHCLYYAATKLNLAEILANEGPLNAAGIAKATGTDAKRIHRFMETLLSQGLFGQSPIDPTMYVNNAKSAVLRQEHPSSMKAFVLHWHEDSYHVWGKTLEPSRQ